VCLSYVVHSRVPAIARAAAVTVDETASCCATILVAARGPEPTDPFESRTFSIHFDTCAKPSFHVTMATNLCCVSPKKQAKTISIILVLLDVAREPIQSLAFLFVRCYYRTRRCFKTFLLRQTFFSCHNGNQPLLHVSNKQTNKQTIRNH
jgi:hypothetical protein